MLQNRYAPDRYCMLRNLSWLFFQGEYWPSRQHVRNWRKTYKDVYRNYTGPEENQGALLLQHPCYLNAKEWVIFYSTSQSLWWPRAHCIPWLYKYLRVNCPLNVHFIAIFIYSSDIFLRIPLDDHRQNLTIKNRNMLPVVWPLKLPTSFASSFITITLRAASTKKKHPSFLICEIQQSTFMITKVSSFPFLKLYRFN